MLKNPDWIEEKTFSFGMMRKGTTLSEVVNK